MNDCERYREMIGSLIDGELDMQSGPGCGHISRKCGDCAALYSFYREVSPRCRRIWRAPGGAQAKCYGCREETEAEETSHPAAHLRLSGRRGLFCAHCRRCAETLRPGLRCIPVKKRRC